jgi:hypothetical protein
MLKKIAMAVAALALAFTVGCGDDNNNNSNQLPDLSRPPGADMAGGGGDTDMASGECAKPSDTCVQSPTMGKDILNGCVGNDVTKEDITPFYPANGYANCRLPAAP